MPDTLLGDKRLLKASLPIWNSKSYVGLCFSLKSFFILSISFFQT